MTLLLLGNGTAQSYSEESKVPKPSYDELIHLKKKDVKYCVITGAVFSSVLYFSLKYEFYIGTAFSSLMTLLLAVAFKNELRNLSELREVAAKQEKLNQQPQQTIPAVSSDTQQLTQERKSQSWQVPRRTVTFMGGGKRRGASADAVRTMDVGRFSYS